MYGSILETTPEVILKNGTKAVLPCRVNTPEELASVVWKKGPTISHGRIIYGLYFLQGPGYINGSKHNDDRFYHMDKNYSLEIAEVRMKDNDAFYCEIVLMDFSFFYNQTKVTVVGERYIISFL